MLTELVYPDRFFIIGKVKDVKNILDEHARHYVLVTDLLKAKAPLN